jgi:hypothetical protein
MIRKFAIFKCGLTVVYINNGSGKSSYTRTKKKLCWSRNPGITLKNVFNPSVSQQQVDFTLKTIANIGFSWMKTIQLIPILVRPNHCGDIYSNNENLGNT